MGALRADESGSVWDGIVGARGHVNLTEKWYLPFYADIGTGQSKLTWQALGGIGYRFKWFDFTVAYRYLQISGQIFEFDNLLICSRIR
jgi:hypothetical protein